MYILECQSDHSGSYRLSFVFPIGSRGGVRVALGIRVALGVGNY